MAIRISLRHLFLLVIFAVYKAVFRFFKVRNLLVELPMILFLLLLGIYHVRYPSKILTKATWYDRLLGHRAFFEKEIKFTGYLLIFLSILFSIITFFEK